MQNRNNQCLSVDYLESFLNKPFISRSYRQNSNCLQHCSRVIACNAHLFKSILMCSFTYRTRTQSATMPSRFTSWRGKTCTCWSSSFITSDHTVFLPGFRTWTNMKQDLWHLISNENEWHASLPTWCQLKALSYFLFFVTENTKLVHSVHSELYIRLWACKGHYSRARCVRERGGGVYAPLIYMHMDPWWGGWWN